MERRLEYKVITPEEEDKLYQERQVFYLYNDYEDIGYKCFYDDEVNKYRYIARMKGQEYEVFKEKSNCLFDTILQPQTITEEQYKSI